MIQNSKVCLSCSRNMEDAKFLSESFNHSGGTMVFHCDCGNETKRTFVPLDLLSKAEWAKQIAIIAGLEETDADLVSKRFNSSRNKKELENII
jgi:hypothetical protein